MFVTGSGGKSSAETVRRGPCARSSLQFFWRKNEVSSVFRAGVSLHSHTMYSEESLEMVPRYTAKFPYLGASVRRQSASGVFRFEDAFWTPPLTPRQAYRLEEKQIQRQLHLPALVSITDHDDIRAGAALRVLERFATVPISTEWTIPFRDTFFHLGVHNLPADEAQGIAAELARFTAQPDENKLAGLLRMLNGLPELLLILNHPLWDEQGIGRQSHAEALGQFLKRYRNFFHGLELNGLRSWEENRRVIILARDLNLPLLSGGDRHGREANAILNLTRANSFSGFVREIRYEGISHIVFMPQYREPLRLRILRTIVDVVRDYPENPKDRKSWSGRMFHRHPTTGVIAPLASLWNDGDPLLVQQFIAAMRVLEWRGVQHALRWAFHQRAATEWMDSTLLDSTWTDAGTASQPV